MKQIIVNRYKFNLVIAFYLIVILNIPSLINHFQINQHSGLSWWNNIKFILLETLLAYAAMLLILSLLSFNHYLLKIVISFFLVLSPLVMYFIVKDKIIVDEFLISNVFNANQREFETFFTLYPLIITVILGVIPSIFIGFYLSFYPIFRKNIKLFEKKKITGFARSIVFFALIPIGLLFAIVYVNNKNLINDHQVTKLALSNFMPLNYTSGLAMYYSQIRRISKVSNNLIPTSNFGFKFVNTKLKDKPIVAVLVIGESSRINNQHYYGYSRNTNQYTEKIKNLTYFHQLYSCGTFTAWSVPCMLSYKTRSEFKEPFTHTNLISVFKKLGFKTWWISGQTAYGSENMISLTAREASEVYFYSSIKSLTASGERSHDFLLFHFIDQALRSNYTHKLIVIELLGSHVDYRNDIAKSGIKYVPTCTNEKCTPQMQLNSYDNSVLYTDKFLATLINKLKPYNSFLLYASDHGESLRVDNSGFLIHGAPYDIAPIEQKHISGLMWVSDNIRKINPDFDNVKYYEKTKISHDYIFSTMFDCLGVTSSVVHKNLSLCQLPSLNTPNEKQ